MNLEHVAEGWYDYIKGAPYTKKLMESRLKICDSCPEKVQISSLGKQIISALNYPENLYKCRKCSCPLGAKTARPGEKCPLGKWGIAGTENYY